MEPFFISQDFTTNINLYIFPCDEVGIWYQLTFSLLRYSQGISRDLIGILFGSRSLLTERDPKEFRTSSEGDPKK